MKKLLFLTLLLGAFQTSKAYYTIKQITVTALNASEININTKVLGPVSVHLSSYNIVNNTITLNICFQTPFTTPWIPLESDFIIPLPTTTASNYILIVNAIGYDCVFYPGDSDTKTLPFSTPLSSPVSLQSTGFNSKNFTVYPNPAQGLISVSNDINYEAIEVVNHLGQLVKRFDRNKSGNYDLNNITKGLYYLVYLNATNEKLGTTKLIKSN
jgi:hypothetical protein